MAADSPIPIVDFAKWDECDKEGKTVIANRLVEACSDIGFCYIVNHNIHPDYLAEAFTWSKRLFDLEQEQKMLAPHPPGFAVHRGYSWPGLEKVSNAMGDEEDAEDLTKKLRQVSDVKVSIICMLCMCNLLNNHRKATRLEANRIRINQTNGSQRKSYLVFESS